MQLNSSQSNKEFEGEFQSEEKEEEGRDDMRETKIVSEVQNIQHQEDHGSETNEIDLHDSVDSVGQETSVAELTVE